MEVQDEPRERNRGVMAPSRVSRDRERFSPVSVKMTPLAHKHVRAITEGWRRRSCNSFQNSTICTELLFIRAPDANEELCFRLERPLRSWWEFILMTRNKQNHVFSFPVARLTARRSRNWFLPARDGWTEELASEKGAQIQETNWPIKKYTSVNQF